MSEETFASLHAKNLIHMAAIHARLAENPLSTSEEDVRRWEALIAAAPETAAERDRLREALQAVVDYWDNQLTSSYCEVCKAHAPKDHEGNLIGRLEHRDFCEHMNVRAALAGERHG